MQGETKEDFLNMRVRDLIDDPSSYLNKKFVTELPEAINFVLASATVLIAVKEGVPQTATSQPLKWLKGPRFWRLSKRVKSR